jgi:hypothetical protein
VTRRGLRKFIGQRVVAHTFDDRSIEGVLAKVHRDVAILDAPKDLDNAPGEVLPAQAVIPRTSESWWQVGL